MKEADIKKTFFLHEEFKFVEIKICQINVMLNGQVWLKCHAVTRENNKHTYHEEVGI